MNPSPNREVALFSAALELPASERASYLDGTCADDPALRLRLEALLRVHEEAITFLENKSPGAQKFPMGVELPGATIGINVAPSEKPGDRIGRYKLLQQIGEGGCGIVYMAEQEEPVRRRVALKVIKLGMDTKQVIARFEAERQALALMDHPNIARIFDAGVTGSAHSQLSTLNSQLPLGRPYFVMELVRGIKITDYCDQNNLSTEERLKLFTQVCQAIQHAHQKGIIHRDIKPSNILVTVSEPGAGGCPKVIDFGIAKATTGQRLTDKTVFTAFEQFIGTPAYMSPEQAMMTSLDIDTRTDVYALGVLLYELLTGQTPFDAKDLAAAGLDAMRRIIREQEPVRPSTRLSTLLAADLSIVARHRQAEPGRLGTLLRGDLDWVVMKALEKDRARRYETANGLAMDIQRHLNCEPVVARPPSRLYEFRKTVRRHKLGFAAAGSVITVLAVGVLASTLEAIRATRAERGQTRLLQVAEAKEKKSEQVARFLKDMLKGVGPSVALGRDTTMLREIVDKTAERVGKDLTNQPEVEVELCLTLADTYHDLGLYKQIEHLARHSLQLARARLGEENESVAASLTWLGDALKHLDPLHFGTLHWSGREQSERYRRLHDVNLLEAERYCREGLAMSRKLLGNQNPKVAWALNNLASVLAAQSRMAEAEIVQREAVALYQKLLGNEHPLVAQSLSELAGFLAAQDDKLAEAESLNREALAMQRKLLGNDHPEIAKSLQSLGRVLSRQGRLAEAEATNREALAMWKKLQANDRLELSGALNNLADILMRQGKLADAAMTYREALAMQKRLFGEVHSEVAMTLSVLAPVLMGQGKLAEAETAYREQLAVKRKLLGDEHPDVGMALNNLANVLQAQGKLAEAEALCRDELASALALFQRSSPDDPKRSNYVSRLGDCQSRLVDVLARAGRSDQAEQALRKALEVFEQAARDFPTELVLREQQANCHSMLAARLNNAGRFDDAEREHRATIAWFAALKEAAPTNPNYWDQEASATWLLAVMLEGAGRRDAAVTEYRHAIALYQKASATFPNHAGIRAQLTQLLREKGKLAGVEGADRATAEQYRKNAQRGDPASLNELAWFLAVCADPKVRDGQAAVGFANQAVAATNRKNHNYLDTLAAACAETGQFDEAVRIQKQAMALLRNDEKETAKGYASRLKLYESGSPCRQNDEQPDTAASLQTLADLLSQHKDAEAEQLLRDLLKRTREGQPQNVDVLRARISFFARRGRWKEAAADLSKLVELDGSDDYDQLKLTALLLKNGDVAGYRAHCQKMVTSFSAAKDPGPLDKTAKACLLVADAGFDLQAACHLADQAVTLGKNSIWLYYFQFVKGLAEYRAGHFASAVDWVGKSIGQPTTVGGTSPDWNRDAAAYSVLAMAQHQLKRPDEARAALAKGIDIVNTKLPKLENGTLDENWTDWLIAHILLREAQALIEGHADLPKNQSKGKSARSESSTFARPQTGRYLSRRTEFVSCVVIRCRSLSRCLRALFHRARAIAHNCGNIFVDRRSRPGEFQMVRFRPHP